MRTRIKICGLTREEDVRAASRLDIEFAGFVVFPPSKRYIAPETVRQLATILSSEAPRIRPVLVTVDLDFEGLMHLHEVTGAEWLQLHGAESPALVDKLRAEGLKIIKAVRVGPSGIAPQWDAYAPDFFLCDTFDPRLAGGTGERWHEEWLPPAFPLNRTLIAGGLTPENVVPTLARLRPFGIDVSSGVERTAGIKDPEKMSRLVAAVRGFDGNNEH
jgi:phosphoribosylanthranilate isomerase